MMTRGGWEPFGFLAASAAWLPVLLDAALKGVIVLAVAGVLCLLLRRASAALRHLIWCVAIGQAVAMPLLSSALPGQPLAVLPQGWTILQSEFPPAVGIRPSPGPDAAAPTAASSRTAASAASPAALPSQPGSGHTRPALPHPWTAQVEGGAAARHMWAWILLAWLLGVVLAATPVLIGAFALWRMQQRVRPITDSSWVLLLESLTDRLRLKRPVRLRQSDQVSMPMTWGVFRPIVLLPVGAENWPEERRWLVLLHELAHIQRADCLTQLLAQLACVLYWFNPLAWFAARQLRVERERACDDRVLLDGARASDYAQHLLEIARGVREASFTSLAAVPMARPSQLEGRLLAVLDGDRSRRSVSRLAVVFAAAVGAGLVLPLAAFEASARVEQNAGTVKAVVRQPPAGGMVIRQVWATADDISGTVSADGRHFSHVDWKTGDLAVRELATGKHRRLTNKGSWAASSECAIMSTLSPDGKQVAYTWAGKHGVDLRLVGLDGSQPRVLYGNAEVRYIEPSAWSPDGQQLLALFFRKDGTQQIVLVSVVGGSARVLKSLAWRYPSKMSFSTDGRFIACDFQAKETSPARDIYLLATDGSREVPLVEHPANDLSPLWTPDGKRILFVSDRTGAFGLWAVKVTNGKPDGAPELVKADMGLIHPLGLTRDGSLYYAFRWREDVYTATLDLEAGRILLPPQSASPRFVGANSRPAWSPDGRYLAYRTSRGYFLDPPLLSIRSLDDDKVRELSPQLGRMNSLQWSADGRSLLVTGKHPKSGEGAFRIDARTGTVTSFAGSDKELRAPAWSRDGRTVFYVDPEPEGSYRIVARDLKTGGEKELHHGDGGVRSLALSPDGRQLAFAEEDAATGSRVIKAMRATGGVSRELCRMEQVGGFGILMMRWTPDGRQLLFGWQTKETTELWRVPAAGGDAQRLGGTMANARHLSVHPDGQQISFHASISDGGAGVWVMENFLPVQIVGASAPQR